MMLVCGLACSVATIALLPKYPTHSSATAQVQHVQPVLMPYVGDSAVWIQSAAESQCSYWQPWADFGSPDDMCEAEATDVAAVDLAEATAVATQQASLIPYETVEVGAETHEVERSAVAQHRTNQGASANKDAAIPAVASAKEAPSAMVESATEVALCSLAAAVHVSTDHTTAVAAADSESTELRHGSTPPEDQILSHFYAADRAEQASATPELAVEVAAVVQVQVAVAVEVEVAAEVEVAQVYTADVHPYAAVAFDSHSSTQTGLSVLAAPAMLSGPVIVEQAAASEDANARMAAELAAIFAWVGNELPGTPTEHSEVPSDPSQTPVEPSGTFNEHRPEVDDVESFTAGDSQNAQMAAELAALFALAGPPPQQSHAEPSSEANAAIGSVVADSVAAGSVVAFSVVADSEAANSLSAESVIADSMIADTAAISLPLQDASTAATAATRFFFDTQLAEDLAAEQSSLAAPVTSAEDFLPTEAAIGVQFVPASEDVSPIHDSCPGMDVSSEANALCITEQHIMTAAAFPQRLHLSCDTALVRRAGGGTAADAGGNVIARAYSHHSVAGEEFSPMVLLGTPELTLSGM